jgi:complex iron-sulfur molybdoenzyme family reductase subunit gamma
MIGLVLLWSTVVLAQQVLVAPFVEHDVSLDPQKAAAVFAQATPLTIPLIPQIIVVPNGGGTVPHLSVQAVHNGKALFLQFTWADAKANRELFKYEEFSDAVAIQFPVAPDVVPTPFMGDAQHPVNIWQWKAAWEADQFGLRGVEQVYPNVHFDFYFEEAYVWDQDLKAAFTPGRAAGNLLSQPVRHSAVEDLVAFGFGTIQSQVQQDVHGAGHWQEGRWSVIMARALTTSDPTDVQFRVGETVLFNVAVWEGSNGDRGGQKSVSLDWWKLALLSR